MVNFYKGGVWNVKQKNYDRIQSGYAEDKKEEGSRALEVLDYIEHLDFTSYADFVKQTTQQKTYNWINNNLGVLQTYMIVCEKLNIPADQRVIDEISLDQAAQDADEDDY